MTLQELKYLIALAEHGHFGRAAEACCISQSTLSTQIKKLEEIRLFKKPAPGRTIGLVWRHRAPFPETFERLAAMLKSSLPAGVEPV